MPPSQSLAAMERGVHRAETRLFQLLQEEVEQIFTTFPYDPNPTHEVGHSTPLLSEFRRFMQRCIQQKLLRLPEKLVQRICDSLLTFTAFKFLSMLYGKDIKFFNMKFVENMQSDLITLETMALRDLNASPEVMGSFAELKQILALLTTPDPHEYLDPVIRKVKYSCLRSSDVAEVIKKYYYHCLFVNSLGRRLKDPPERRLKLADLALLLN